MAGGNLGSLSMELNIKSNIDKQMQSHIANIKKAEEEVQKYKEALDKATKVKNKTDILNAAENLSKARDELSKLKTSSRGIETRAQQVLNITHDITNAIKTLRSNAANIRLFDPSGLKEAGNELSRVIGMLRKLYVNVESSPFTTGEGFRAGLGELKRYSSDVKKEINSISSSATKQANAASREVQKTLDKAEKAEAKAVEYYVTRKQRVDDAIQSLSQRQARFAELARNSSAEDARMLRSMGDAAEAIKQRLLAAKTEYEHMQQLKAQGVPGAALSSTFLGRSTGMAELFGGQYGMAYNDFVAKSKEAVSLAEKHNAELKKQEELQDRIDKLQDRINKNITSNRDKVTDISSVIKQIQERWAAIQSNPNFNTNLLPSGFNKKIKDLESLLRALQSVDLTKTGSVTELLSRRHFGTLRREVNAVFSEIERGYRRTDSEAQRNANEAQRTAETIRRTYARLFDQLNALRNARANANILGINTDELDKAISRVLFKLKALRDLNPNSKTYNGSNLLGYQKSTIFSDADSKREETLVNRLIAKYQQLNAEKRKSNADVIQQEARAAQQLASAFDRVHNSASKSSQVLSDIKSLFLQGGLVFAAQQFANSIIKTGGDIVQQHIALRSILGDVQKADTLFAQTQQLALQSPFTFQELNRDVKQLAAFGVDTDRLYDTTKRLADVASGLGVSFERLGLAYGQVKARSWLDGKELRQFAYAGLPMLQKIADLYNETGKNGRRNYTTSDVRNMITKRQVSFEDVDKVFQRLTDEGGQFYNMQFVLSETLLGRWNKLLDAWTIMLGKFADGQSVLGNVFSTAIDGATQLVLALDKVSPFLLSFGTLFLGRRIFGGLAASAGVGVNNIVRQMSLVQAQQIKTYANTQMQRVAEGEISAELARQNVLKQQQLMSSKTVQGLTYAQLLAEGRISTMQVAQLFRRGQISLKLVEELQRMRLITAEQRRQIVLAKYGASVRARANAMGNLGMMSAWGSIGSFFTRGNLAMIGASIGMALWMGYREFSNRIEEAGEAAVQHAKQQAATLRKEIASAIESGPTQSAVKNMMDIVEGSSNYTKSMQEQVENATTLKEKYDALLSVMQEMAKESEKQSKYKTNVDEALKATKIKSDSYYLESAWDRLKHPLQNGLVLGSLSDLLGFHAVSDWMTGGGLDEDLKNYTSDKTLYTNSISALQDYANQIHSTLESIKGDYADTYKDIQGKSFEDQLKILSQSDAWDEIKDRISESDNSFKGLAETYEDKSDDVDRKWKVIVDGDIPRLANSLAEQYNMNLSEFQSYCQMHPKYATEMIHQVVDSLHEGSAETKNELINALIDFFGVASRYKVSSLAPNTVDVQNALFDGYSSEIGKKIGENVKKMFGSVDKSAVNQVAGQQDDWSKAVQNLQGLYKTAEDNYNYARQAGVTGKELSDLKTERDKWANIGKANGIALSSPTDKANDKAAKAAEAARRKREQAAERARRDAERREREYLRARQKEASSIQSYYETFEKWRQIEGENRAKARVANDERFSNISGKYKDPSELAENYKTLAASILKASGSYEKMSDERKQVYDDLMGRAANKEAQIELENAQRLVNAFKEQLDYMSRRYEWYQKLAKVAGKETAGPIVFNSEGHSESYYSYLRNRVEKLLKGEELQRMPGATANGGAEGNMNDGYTLPAAVIKATFVPKLDLDQLAPGTTLEKALDMGDDELRRGLGKNAEILIKLKQERDKLDESIIESLVQGGKYYDDQSAQLDAINQKYDEMIERLKQRNQLDENDVRYINDKSLRQQETILNQQRRRDTAAVNYNQSQKSDAYARFFGTSYLLSTREAQGYANALRTQVQKAFKNDAISAGEYSSEIEKINDKMKEISEQRSGLFTYLFDGGIDGALQQRYNQGKSQFEEYSKRAEEYRKKYDEAQVVGDDKAMADAQKGVEAAQAMADEGESMMKGANSAMAAVAVIDKVIQKINENVQSLKALVDDIGQSIEIFAGSEHAENFKNSKGYAFISGFSSASQGAADAWSSLKSGNVMGVVEGGYRSIVGWAEPWARRHDAKLDKQIQIAERTNKIISSMQSSIERTLSSTLGGVYGYTSNDRDVDKFKEGLDNYSLAKTGAKYGRNTVGQSTAAGIGIGATAGTLAAIGGVAAAGGLGLGVATGAAFGTLAGPIGLAAGAIIGGIVGALFGHGKKKYRTNYTEDTYASMEKAYQTGAYYDQMYASYKMQRDNLNAQMKAEQDKKNKDKDKIQDYQSQLDELDDKIQTFAKDMAKSLYDIDLQSWAKELTDAVVSAWAAGEDAVEAYKDKVKELMRTLATNIISQKIMEKALQPVEDYIEKEMDVKSGKLDEEDIIGIANMLSTIGDSTIPSIVDLMEKLKDNGWDLSDTGDSSMSGSIKSITENTADLLAAYLNAIRADVSVIRQFDSIYLPKLDITATAQLQQQIQIAQNTLRNAQAAEQIQASVIEVVTILNAVVNDHKRFNTSAH